MWKLVASFIFCILGMAELGYAEQPIGGTAPKARILIGSPVRQKPKILKEFLESLERQSRVAYSTDFFFIDDNVEDESHQILMQFQQKMGGGCCIELPLQDHVKTEYKCDEEFYSILNSKYTLSVAATGYTVIEFIDDSKAVVKIQSCKSFEVVE